MLVVGLQLRVVKEELATTLATQIPEADGAIEIEEAADPEETKASVQSRASRAPGQLLAASISGILADLKRVLSADVKRD